MDHDTWATAAIAAAVEWATAPSNDIGDMQKSGFVMGAQNKALSTGYRIDEMDLFGQKILTTAWLAGQLWSQDHPMPTTATATAKPGSRSLGCTD